MNMSYCRFENTVKDMWDCQDHLWDEEDLSDEEKRYRQKFIEICREVADEFPENLDEEDEPCQNLL